VNADLRASQQNSALCASSLPESGNKFNKIAWPGVDVELGTDDLLPPCAYCVAGARQREDESAIGQAADGTRLNG
jgi:hypothetical protein